MTKITGSALAAHIAEQNNPDSKFSRILLDSASVQTTLSIAQSAASAYAAADANFRAMEKSKSDEIDRSLSALKLANPGQHKADAMREWRRGALANFESIGGLEGFRTAQKLLDVVRDTEEHFAHGAVSIAGRHGLIGDTSKYREAWDRVNGAGVMELRNVATVAMATRNKDLAAACIRRLEQLDEAGKKLVGITHRQLADSAFGEEYNVIAHSLSAIRETANRIVACYRSRVRGGDGEPSSLNKISQGLAEFRRGPTPPTPSGERTLCDPVTGKFNLPDDVKKIMREAEARARGEKV